MESAMNSALTAVLKATMLVRKAAKEYGIPRTTLLDRPDYVRKILKELVDAAVDCVKSGFSAHRAAKMCAVSIRTVRQRLSGRSSKRGPPRKRSQKKKRLKFC